MAEGYDPAEEESCRYSWLSEWLCEYVDGTMDPSLRAVFEEYLEANPELRAHIQRLCRTRELLEQCACREHPMPETLRARLCRQTESEMMQPRVPFLSAMTERSATAEHAGMFIAMASAMAIMLGVGVLIGAMLFGEPSRLATISAVSPSAAAESTQAKSIQKEEAPPRTAPERAAAQKDGEFYIPAYRPSGRAASVLYPFARPDAALLLVDTLQVGALSQAGLTR